MLFQNLVGDPRLAAGLAQDRRVRAAMDQNAGQGDLESRHPLHARGHGVVMHPVAAAHQRPVNVEEIRVLLVPYEIRLDEKARFLEAGFALLLCFLHDSGREISALAVALAKRAVYRTFAPWRTLELGAHFGKIQAQLSHGAAQRVAMHAEFFRRLALVSPVRHQHLPQILPLEIAHRLFIAEAARVHLRNQAFQFSFHSILLPITNNQSNPSPGSFCSTISQDFFSGRAVGVQPLRRFVFQQLQALAQAIAQLARSDILAHVERAEK